MQTLSRLFFLSILVIVWACSIESAEERERSAQERPGTPRYRVYFPNHILPVFVGVLAVVSLLIREVKLLLAACFSVFLHTSFYYLFLAVAMPLLRRRVNARVCAVLWLLPNYLYLVFNDLIVPRIPKRVIYVPETSLTMLTLIWLSGCFLVLGWKILSHFRFRHTVLRATRAVEEDEILALWKDELERAGYPKRQYALVRSPAVQTPLTIGFLPKSIRVVLPERRYTPEQLRLIFRHELVHIGREDSATKFFLAFCTAMCWFNPLMWWAMRKSADDLELSCDETVLLDAPEHQRRSYAALLLRTAGDERGFTTCLSASAKSLRYRLHYVMQPTKRFTGSLLAGVILFLLILSCGHVTLAFDRMTGAELIFGGKDPAQFELVDDDIFWYAPGDYRWPEAKQPQALKAYLAELEVYEISDMYDCSDNDRDLTMKFRTGEQTVRVVLADHTLYVSGTHHDARHYFLPAEIDWEYLGSLLG